MVNNENCGLEDECLEFLCEFPDRVPHRCRLCTDTVRFILERLKVQKATPRSESDVWRGDFYEV